MTTVKSLALLLAVLVCTQPSIAQKDKKPTAPQVTIIGTLDEVKAGTAYIASLTGMVIDTDTSYQMSLSHEVLKKSLRIAMMHGTGATARAVVHFQFLRSGDSIRVTALSELVVQTNNGPKRENITNDKDLRELQSLLDSLKNYVESQPPDSGEPPRKQ